MRQTQVLSSGLTIRQDFAEAVRPVFFQTEHEEFLYATHGGTLFLVVFNGRVYGVTCAHVFGDFRMGGSSLPERSWQKRAAYPAM
jgi:hypothetical protein